MGEWSHSKGTTEKEIGIIMESVIEGKSLLQKKICAGQCMHSLQESNGVGKTLCEGRTRRKEGATGMLINLSLLKGRLVGSQESLSLHTLPIFSFLGSHVFCCLRFLSCLCMSPSLPHSSCVAPVISGFRSPRYWLVFSLL